MDDRWRHFDTDRASSCRDEVQLRNFTPMFRAFGFVIVLWYLSLLFSQTFQSADSALSESFKTLEASAIKGQEQLRK